MINSLPKKIMENQDECKAQEGEEAQVSVVNFSHSNPLKEKLKPVIFYFEKLLVDLDVSVSTQEEIFNQ